MHLTKYAGADERLMEKSKPVTPLGDRRYEGFIAPVSLFNVRGLCPKPKCVLKEGHAAKCWPSP